MLSARRQSYDGIVAAVPVTVPYERFSIESTHWWIGRALRALAQGAGLGHRDFDGFIVASFSTAPDTAIGLTQHFGLAPRWLDHLAMGGVSGIMSLRRAARAVLSAYVLATLPAFGAVSVSHAACLSLSHWLRAELRTGDIARDIRERLTVNPKAQEQEIGL